jgi:DNA ligase (NAD+)
MDRSITRLRAIEIGVGTDGVATPVGIVDPVSVAGHTLTRALFSSAAFVRDNDVRIGDAVAVESSNGTGASIAEVVVEMRTGNESAIHMPYACPTCGCDLRQMGADLVCPSAACPQQLTDRLSRIASRDAFDMPEFDAATLSQLISSGLVGTPADLFKIRERELVKAGWPAGRVRDMIGAIVRAKNVSLDRLLVAMTGIDASAARSIAVHARSLARVKRLVAGSMARLPNVGTQVAEAVANFMREPRNRKILAQMARAGVVTARIPAGVK